LAIALITASAATWCYLIGETEGYYLGFLQGSIALFAGSMIGMFLVFVAAGPTCIRFGIESLASIKPQFGSRGWILPGLLQQVSIVGWNSLLLIFFGKSLTQLLTVLGWIPQSLGARHIVAGTTPVACALVYMGLLWGARGVARISNFLVFHVFVGFWMLYLLVSHRWPELVTARPPLARPDRLWNYTTGVEIGISSILGWWAYIGAMVRMAASGRAAAVPVMLGMGAPVPLLSLIGLAGVLVLQVSDPSEWLRTVGGRPYAIIALGFVAAANFGTAMVGIYAAAIGLRNFAMVDKLPWPLVLLLPLMPVALVGMLIPDLFFAHFGAFLAFMGVAFAPLCGIQIADYYFIRRRRIDIRAIYDQSPAGRYRYWAGVNPAAIVALAFGCAVYLYLLNPLTFESHGPYRWVSASVPAAVLSGCLYMALTYLFVIPARRGGYETSVCAGSRETWETR
jgi:NCS1 family nucleobase:cation symporter-1